MDKEIQPCKPFVGIYSRFSLQMILDLSTFLEYVPTQYDTQNGIIWFNGNSICFNDKTIRISEESITKTYIILRGFADIYNFKIIDNNVTADLLKSKCGNKELHDKYYSIYETCESPGIMESEDEMDETVD